MSDVLRKWVATTVFATCAAAASAQQASVETGSADEAPAQSGQLLPQLTMEKTMRYSAGESIVLGLAAPPAQNRVFAAAPQAISAGMRYSAGDSIVLGPAPAVENPLAADVKAAEPDRTSGYSQAALIPLAAAVGDSVTTYIGLNHASLAEKNGLVNTSTAGLVGLFVIKAGITYYFDRQPKKIRESGLKVTAGVWSGVTMNNLLLIAGSSNPLSLVGGVLFGAYMYHRESLALEKEAAGKRAPLPSARHMGTAE
ncbi:MAG: hypothetical protein RR311_04865 [Comamonas sp.]